MHQAAGQDGRIRCAPRYLKWLYWAAAAGLAPWIVYLYLTQIPRALAHQLRILVIGIILVTILGVLVTAWMYSRRISLTVMAATYTATTAFISVWFRILTRGGGSNLGESRPVFMVAAGITVLLCVSVIAASRSTIRRAWARWLLPAGLVAAALTLVPSLAIALIVRPNVRIENHLQIAWTGLDMFELLAMAVTGLALHRRSASVVIPATITGALLLCDAWINITPVRGAARTQAIYFAFLEVPLAFLSLWIALQVSRRSSGSPLPAAVPPCLPVAGCCSAADGCKNAGPAKRRIAGAVTSDSALLGWPVLRGLGEPGQPLECLLHSREPRLPILHVVADAPGGAGAVRYLGDDRGLAIWPELIAQLYPAMGTGHRKERD